MLSEQELIALCDDCLAEVEIPFLGERLAGKVRDSYRLGDRRVLITTDRVSAFDRVLGLIPCKGQVLNRLAAWWFEQTADIVPNHLIAVPHPNVTIAREAQPLPIEVVVRGYITGVTDTSLWQIYAAGERAPYGVALPDGLRKHDPLPTPILTPTTKAQDGQHDRPITPQEIVASGLVSAELWQEIARVSLALFARGQALAARGGLILVDTKYEFGLIDGQLTLIDEIHTPDSSRYWDAERYAAGEIVNYSKEFMREWFADQGYRGEGVPPVMPPELRAAIAARYLAVYERITGGEIETRDRDRDRDRGWARSAPIPNPQSPIPNSQSPLVGVIMGSKSDWETMRHAHEVLAQFGVPHECEIVSAHRTPHWMVTYAESAEKRGIEVIIAGAGGAAHLPGMTAGHTLIPVLGVPVQSRALNGLDSLLSIVQMPGGVPVATLSIGAAGATNAALLAVAILSNNRPLLREKLALFRAEQAERVRNERLPTENDDA
jgi:phosphoribosylaminoimidazole-succinocarboxamide synthase